MHQTDERGVGSGVFNMNKEPADTNWNKNAISEKDPQWTEKMEKHLLPTTSLYSDFHMSGRCEGV